MSQNPPSHPHPHHSHYHLPYNVRPGNERHRHQQAEWDDPDDTDPNAHSHIHETIADEDTHDDVDTLIEQASGHLHEGSAHKDYDMTEAEKIEQDRTLLAKASIMSREAFQSQEIASINKQQQQHPEQQQIQQMQDAVGVGVIPDDVKDDEQFVEEDSDDQEYVQIFERPSFLDTDAKTIHRNEAESHVVTDPRYDPEEAEISLNTNQSKSHSLRHHGISESHIHTSSASISNPHLANESPPPMNLRHGHE